MVDVLGGVGAVTAVFGSLKSGLELLKGLRELKGSPEDVSKIMEVQAAILGAQSAALTAQAEHFALLAEVRELREALSRSQAWESDKARYILTRFGQDTYAYSIKSDCLNGEPEHLLCPTCFEQRRKSILQFQSQGEGQAWHKCLYCDKLLPLGTRSESRGAYRPVRSASFDVFKV